MAKPPEFKDTVLLDTTVTLRAFWPEQFSDDPRTKDCAELVHFLKERKALILLSAVTLAEFEIGDSSRKLPVYEGIEVVSFDRMAAHVLSGMLDPIIEQQMRDDGTTRPGVRYDLQIGACAIRHGAGLLATLDDKFRKAMVRIKKAGLANVEAMTPTAMLSHFGAQVVIPEFRDLEAGRSPAPADPLDQSDG